MLQSVGGVFQGPCRFPIAFDRGYPTKRKVSLCYHSFCCSVSLVPLLSPVSQYPNDPSTSTSRAPYTSNTPLYLRPPRNFKLHPYRPQYPGSGPQWLWGWWKPSLWHCTDRHLMLYATNIWSKTWLWCGVWGMGKWRGSWVELWFTLAWIFGPRMV